MQGRAGGSSLWCPHRPQQTRRLDGGSDGFGTYVAGIAGAIERLLLGITSEDTEEARDARIEGDTLDAGGGLRRDVQVVVRLMAYDGAQTDNGIVAAAFGQALGYDG